jgi:hypothetical protein
MVPQDHGRRRVEDYFVFLFTVFPLSYFPIGSENTFCMQCVIKIKIKVTVEK